MEESTMKKDYKSHWDKAYIRTEFDKLGWYEENPEPSLRLINKCKLKKTDIILNVGAGATTLVDNLLEMGFNNIIANDISSEAIEELKQRLGKNSQNVKWVLDDLTKPLILNNLEKVDLWHDRAVLHFFNSEYEQDSYFDLINKLVKKNGHVIIAAFNLDGARKCCGLPVHRYDRRMLQEKLGTDFVLLEEFDYTYHMPSGDTREYVYTLFKRLDI